MNKDSRFQELQLFGLVLFCLLMAVGPGAALVNRAEFIFGIPTVYAWAIFWYLVLCLIAICSFRKKQTSNSKNSDETP